MLNFDGPQIARLKIVIRLPGLTKVAVYVLITYPIDNACYFAQKSGPQ